MMMERSQVGVSRKEPFVIKVNGDDVVAYPGETVAAALLASGRHIFGYSYRKNSPQSLFCGIGVCFGCIVTVDNIPFQRACKTLTKPKMIIEFDTSAEFAHEDV